VCLIPFSESSISRLPAEVKVFCLLPGACDLYLHVLHFFFPIYSRLINPNFTGTILRFQSLQNISFCFPVSLVSHRNDALSSLVVRLSLYLFHPWPILSCEEVSTAGWAFIPHNDPVHNFENNSDPNVCESFQVREARPGAVYIPVVRWSVRGWV
jgi:hypothetical protein